MASDVDICNRALSRLGMPRIAALADANESGYACNSALAIVRDEVLRAHPWNCATKRATLTEVAAKAITSTTAANPVQVNCTGHGFATNSRIYIQGVTTATSLNNRFFRVGTPNNVNDFKLLDEALTNIDGTSYGAGTGGTARQVPDWDYDNMYTLPSDCLRVLEIEDMDADSWVVENGSILVDQATTIQIRYITQLTTYTLMDPQLVNVLAARLAIELMEELPEFSATKRQQMYEWYERAWRVARAADGQEMSSKTFKETEWVTGRL